MISFIIFALATVLSLALGTVVRRYAPVMGTVVPPQPDRWHNRATPTMGGIAIAVATFLAFAVATTQIQILATVITWGSVLSAAFAMFFVGVLDDRLKLSPLAKLVASLIVGAFLVFVLTQNNAVGLPAGYILISIVWFAGVCHAFNLLDNMDGLAAGVALIAAAFFLWLQWGLLDQGLILLLLSLAGALLGFLYWNRNRAKLFMGDCGSLFIGAMFGGISLIPVLDAGTTFSIQPIFAVLILVVPLFDTGFVLVLRRLAGRAATRGGTDHVSHRLVSLGFSERSAVRILYLLGIIGGLTAWGLMTVSGDTMLPVVALFTVLVVLLGLYLARVPAYDAGDFNALQESSFAPFLKDLTFRWHAGEVLLDLVLISACYYFAYWLRFEDEALLEFLPSFGESLPVVLGVKLASLYSSGLYRRSWETFGLRDIAAVLRGVGLGSVLSVLTVAYLYRFERFSRGVFVLDALLLTVAVIATRASFRAMNLIASSRSKRSQRILIYGAGAFGQLLVREMRANQRWRMNPVAFIDDDQAKLHRWIAGVPVYGGLDKLESTMRNHDIDQVILSTPEINSNTEQRIHEISENIHRPVRRLYMEIK